MKRSAFGILDLLLGLLIISFIFIICKSTIMPDSAGNSIRKNEIKTETEQKINEIESMRNQAIEYNKQIIKDNDLN